MPDSNQQKMYENEHAEYLFDEVLSPTAWRGPREQGRLDACHHLARLVEQLEAAQERAIPPHWANIFEEHERLKEQLEAADAAMRWISDNYPKALREMPTPLFRALTSNPASVPHDLADNLERSKRYAEEQGGVWTFDPSNQESRPE